MLEVRIMTNVGEHRPLNPVRCSVCKQSYSMAHWRACPNPDCPENDPVKKINSLSFQEVQLKIKGDAVNFLREKLKDSSMKKISETLLISNEKIESLDLGRLSAFSFDELIQFVYRLGYEAEASITFTEKK